ncbi:NADH dehydrogenase [candidate division WOR-1 bacterium RIFOXYA12_FULL_52_29]|uniref:NADH dehydrogenase n=1 Tax=candidate division WOR-1 bacterium RIFOXYC12_FULL_54_18 TaxID=1802584 RepID=A0A1F4T6H8_UNCSA|nr:MAG: NADH dehydrogenase [candidate division WOR-1 bacterium RIFOXYA2_FULL_51_19]OGC17266.1 MAG: NADH dehydrogenase [candidate division WOR-1 bacterium RIFOXYA12_FULL_52_29]OGC26126.1 MAG: NADH dehydrogenase [candidate division WOR-1 bacterium RIFOXYB2_FULL_45_9]OGC27683.1 MAG: NADH dehydrogenase [candidate division WOR-1 bacterium RIFOXYC12_FULL_54_18]OGC30026.1 MAG: NADH dehydrogenase [candidate division WOR-1 bacterium RIFOXYB12_FULL_52_16]
MNKQVIIDKTLAGKKDNIVVSIGASSCGIAAGAEAVFKAFAEEIKKNSLRVELKKCGCLGMCSAEPLVEVKMPGKASVVYGRVNKEIASKIVTDHLLKGTILKDYVFEANKGKQLKIVLRNCGVIDPENIDEYIAREGYDALKKVLSTTPETAIEELKKSGLRGRGGAGFPTWMKWSLTRASKGELKYIICNGDEGDPGAYMDRSVLEGDPHSVLEGLIIGGYCAGAKQGYFYIRAEYPLAIARIQKAIDQALASGFLGKNILGSDFSFEVEIRLGAGAFVCGEETSLIASIEGESGRPRQRPPYPSERGLWGKPTMINNVETLANIPVVFLRGGSWFSEIGTEKSKGTKVFAVTGKVKDSGLVEVPMGTTLREIVFDICGGIAGKKKIKAVQTGGPSGGVIPEKHLDTPVDYDNLQKLGSIMGSGGMIVMDETDCMVDISKFYLGFCVDESCGKCAPCKIGGYQMLKILERISEGKGALTDLDLLKSLCQTMQKTSFCGLGQTASNPVLSTLRYFEDEYKEHIEEKKCRSHKCSGLLNYRIVEEKCKLCGLCQKNCPTEAIEGSRDKGYKIIKSKCVKCGKCYDVCRFDAVQKG